MRIGCAAIMLLAFPTLAGAQPVIDIATDNELRAAYCIGALQTGFQTEFEIARSERLRAYLGARGAFTIGRSRMASQGLNVAVEKGHADGVACHRKRSLASCEGPDHCIENELPF